MPSKIVNYTAQIKRFHICRKGNNHAQQPLNLICLDPICRKHPLACPTCLSEYHKLIQYHKTLPLGEFISDYQGSIKKNHKEATIRKIAKQHEKVDLSLKEFRRIVNEKLNSYQQSIEEYFNFMYNSLEVRQELQKALNVNLDPRNLIQAHSQQQLEHSVKFIIQNSLFNEENRLINVSSILKFDESRTLALLDKVVNQNLKYQTEIQLELKKLDYAKQTLAKESIRIQNMVKAFNETNRQQDENILQKPTLTFNPSAFVEKQTFNTTLDFIKFQKKLSNPQKFVPQRLNGIFKMSQGGHADQNTKSQKPLFVFSNVYKHEKLQILDNQKQSLIKSNLTAMKPQYALICPSLDYEPKRQQNWSIKIKSCRNFSSSKNTIALGLCSLNQASAQNYEQNLGRNMLGQYILTSQGFLIKNGREQKCDFTFTAGDTVHLKYDPYYNLLIIYKDNGRKVTIKTSNQTDGKLYGCVRLTYASDQVQIMNDGIGTLH